MKLHSSEKTLLTMQKLRCIESETKRVFVCLNLAVRRFICEFLFSKVVLYCKKKSIGSNNVSRSFYLLCMQKSHLPSHHDMPFPHPGDGQNHDGHPSLHNQPFAEEARSYLAFVEGEEIH